jgi:hypothetical protein
MAMAPGGEDLVFALQSDGTLWRLAKGHAVDGKGEHGPISVSVQSLVRAIGSSSSTGIVYVVNGQLQTVLGGVTRTVRLLPGYTFNVLSPSEIQVRWCPGIEHYEHPHVVSASAEGTWTPAPDYVWVGDPNNLTVRFDKELHDIRLVRMMAGASRPGSGINVFAPLTVMAKIAARPVCEGKDPTKCVEMKFWAAVSCTTAVAFVGTGAAFTLASGPAGLVLLASGWVDLAYCPVYISNAAEACR